MKFIERPEVGRSPTPVDRPPTEFVWAHFVWLVPEDGPINVIDEARGQVTLRAAALARLLGRARVASRHAPSLLGMVVHREDALKSLIGSFLLWPVRLREVLNGEIPVVVLPDQVGPVARLYQRAFTSLSLRTSSLSDEGVVTFEFDATGPGLEVRGTGTCPLVGDPPRLATWVEAGEHGSATMDVDWRGDNILERTTGQLRFALYPNDLARLWRTWAGAIIQQLRRRGHITDWRRTA